MSLQLFTGSNIAKELQSNNLIVIENARITVRNFETPTLAKIYSDSSGTVLSNPFIADDSGAFSFYILPGKYIVEVDKDGVTGKLTVSVAEPRVFDNVADMIANFFGENGQIAETLGYYEKGDGGAATYIATEVDPLNPADNYCDHDVNVDQQLNIITDGILNVKQCGAKGDTQVPADNIPVGTDDYEALQAVLNRVKETWENVYFPKGAYGITQTLIAEDFNRICLYSDSMLQGGKIIVLGTVDHLNPIPAVIRWVGNAEKPDLRHIAFDCKGRATIGLDFSNNNQELFGVRNAYLYKVIIDQIPNNGIGIRGLSFNVHVDHCDILGEGFVYDPGNNWLGTGVWIDNASNGCYITNTYIRRLGIGVTADPGQGHMDQVNISNCLFDFCTITAIYIPVAVRRFGINNNYFEGCNQGLTTVSVPVEGGTEEVSAQIILSAKPGDIGFSYVQSCEIEGNNFISSFSDDVIALSTAFKVNIENNNVRYKGGSAGTDKYDSFVKLFGYGVAANRQYTGSTLYMDKNNLRADTINRQGPAVEKVLDATTNFSASGKNLENIVCKDTIYTRTTNISSLMDVSPITYFNDSLVFDAVYTDASKEWIKFEKVLDPGSGFPVPTFDLNNYLSAMRGEHLRLEFESINSAMGISPRFIIDDGVKTFEVTGGDGDEPSLKPASISYPFYVDPNATKLEIKLEQFGQKGDYNLFRSINVVPIWVDVGEGAQIKNDYRMTKLPTIEGYWEQGDFILNSAPSSGSLVGWRCIKSTDATPAIFEEVLPGGDVDVDADYDWTGAHDFQGGISENSTPLSVKYEPVISPKNSAFNVDFGTSSGTACEGNDSRLSDARTPVTTGNYTWSGVNTFTLTTTFNNGIISNKEVFIDFNTLSPTFADGHLELRTGDGSDVSMGFHRGGFTACQLRHESNGLILSGDNRTNPANLSVLGSILEGGTLLSSKYAPLTHTHSNISVNSGDGLSGGGNLSTNRTLNVDSTVVRTSGNQTLSGTKTFSSATVHNGGVNLGANDRLNFDGGTTFYMRESQGALGTVSVYGGNGGFAGYAIEAGSGFFAAGSDYGLRDLTNGQWSVYATKNAGTGLRYQGDTKIVTTATGVTVTGTVNETSSLRYKDIKKTESREKALDIIHRIGLNGTSVGRWKDKKAYSLDPKGAKKDIKFLIAEEVEKISKEYVEYNENGEVDSIQTSAVVADMASAISLLYDMIMEDKNK